MVEVVHLQHILQLLQVILQHLQVILQHRPNILQVHLFIVLQVFSFNFIFKFCKMLILGSQSGYSSSLSPTSPQYRFIS
jgi:hypothetical protein